MLRTKITYSTLALILIAAAIIGALCSSCSRLLPPDKRGDVPFKKSFYFASAAEGLNGIFEGVVVLETNAQITPEHSNSAKKLILSSAKILLEADDLRDKGKGKDAADKILLILDSLKLLQDQNAFYISNPQNREWFSFGVELAKTAVIATSNFWRKNDAGVVISSSQLAKISEAQSLRSRSGVPVFLLELVNVIIRVQVAINNLALLPNADAVRSSGRATLNGLVVKLEPISPSKSLKARGGIKRA